MKKRAFYIACYLICFGTLGTILAPDSARAVSNSGPVGQEQLAPTGCELNSSTLSNVHHELTAIGPDSLVIVVARLGDHEKSAKLNLRRLQDVKSYLVGAWKRSAKTLVLTQGERVSGFGRVEFYIGGRLFDRIVLRRNGDLMLDKCGE